ncbi:CobW family GTP-binding protein [Faecalispora anaeroviscerum]|uniref:CobW family GTP-binding protein n=1 Tax=Faecalispora anaeroviscerum TaxID=2991836 RepID=UPI0024BA99B7|nr:GTP-binding protein [Faecalispora anaeroviscerum]
MKTDIYIISGFLGAGKTTLIGHLLREVFDPKETVVIENDFGEVSLDASLIRSGGFAVKELSAGCICCSLTGDFQAAILEVLCEFSPKQILIEPSGVGKLSDIEAACRSAKILDMAQIRRKITVADVVRCRMYIENFGEFYKDQIRHADAILLSRTEQNPDKISVAKTLLATLAPEAQIFSSSLDSLDFSSLLGKPAVHETNCHEDACCCHRHFHDHHHDECGHDPHDHAAYEAFDTVTLSLSRTMTRPELEEAFHTAEKTGLGLLRAKGIVNTPDGPATVQYLPGELNLTLCDLRPGSLCLIGRDLNEQELKRVFGKE